MNIDQIIKDKNTVFVFDVDGTLTKLKYGTRTHEIKNFDRWVNYEEKVKIYGSEIEPIKTFQKFIAKRDKDKIFVCSKTQTEEEENLKVQYLMLHYGIDPDNIYYVKTDEEKLEVMKEIQKRTGIDDERLVLVEDSLVSLKNVMFNSNYSTIHISYFLE